MTWAGCAVGSPGATPCSGRPYPGRYARTDFAAARPRSRRWPDQSRRGARAVHRRAAARAGPGGRRGPPPALPGRHRDVHHRPQHQLHQRLRHRVQVLRVLPAAASTTRAGRTPSRRSCAAVARRSSSAPPRSCCRAATPRTSASSGTRRRSRAIKADLPAARPCTRSAGPRWCTSPGCPSLDFRTVIERLHAAGLDSFAGAGRRDPGRPGPARRSRR